MTEIKLYRPANGAEGMDFMEHFCDKCGHNSLDFGCPILNATEGFNINDPEYPKQWRYDEYDNPVCIAFRDEGQ